MSERNPNEILHSRIWPYQGHRPDPEASRRHAAIFRILGIVSQDDFSALNQAGRMFHWFIPNDSDTAILRTFLVRLGPKEPEQGAIDGEAHVLYLSPILDRWPEEALLCAVAHQLAHIALAYHAFGPGEEGRAAREEAALAKVREWGFGQRPPDIRRSTIKARLGASRLAQFLSPRTP